MADLKSDPYGGVKYQSYEEALSSLGGIIDSLNQKVNRGRMGDIQKEKLKLEFARVAIYGYYVYFMGLKGLELSEIEARISALESDNCVK